MASRIREEHVYLAMEIELVKKFHFLDHSGIKVEERRNN